MIEKLKAHFILLLATFLVAGSFLASQKLSGVIDSVSLTLFRFVFSSALLAPIILIRKEFRKKVLQTLPRASVVSLFYSLYFIGLFKALETTTVLNTGTLFTLVPFLTAVISIIVFKQHMKIPEFFIYLVGTIGTSIVIFKADFKLFLGFQLNYGDIIFLFAVLFMSLYSITAKYFYKKGDELLVFVFVTLISGCIWMGLALMFYDIPLQWYKIKGDLFFYMSYLTIGATLFTVYLYQKANIALGPKKVMAYTYLNPVAILVLEYIIYSKTVQLAVFIGILLSTFATVMILTRD